MTYHFGPHNVIQPNIYMSQVISKIAETEHVECAREHTGSGYVASTV